MKTLARDLPAFDSVWIDALVQARKLTSFQARLIESGAADQLSIGPYVLFNELGHSHSAKTYLARHLEDKTECVLKVTPQSRDELGNSLKRLEKLIEKCDSFQHPSVIVPVDCFEHNDAVVVVSRFLQGPNLSELLVRRGRFPSSVVAQIASQLIDGLAVLEKHDAISGDIRLPNVRLSSAGVAVIVDAGIAPAISPHLVIHNRLAPERCDGVAPERIGTGQPSTSATDVYSLGCLLWHLLAGRPPFPTGDPLAKLAAHQTSVIPDIRELAPDTPEPLAELIKALTSHEPAYRPLTFAEIARSMRRPGRSSKRQLKEFHSQFNTPATRLPITSDSSNRGFRWSLAVAMLFVLTGASLTLFDQGFDSVVLSLKSRIDQFTNSSVPVDPAAGSSNGGTAAGGTNADGAQSASMSQHASSSMGTDVGNQIPQPNANGVIELRAGEPYAAESLKLVGRATIRCVDKEPAVVIVSGQPWSISAEQVVLQNIVVKHEAELASNQKLPTSSSLIKIYSQAVFVERCRLETTQAIAGEGEPRADSNSTQPVAGIAWKAIDDNAPSGSRCAVKGTFFCGAGPAFRLYSTPRKFQVLNSLKQEAGPFLELVVSKSATTQFQLQFRNFTMRDATSLLRIRSTGDSTPAIRGTITAENSVFDFKGEGSALTGIESKRLPRPEQLMIQITGDSSLISYDKELLVWNRPNSNTFARIVGNSIEVDGLMEADYEFAGPLSRDAASSKLRSTNIPRRSPKLPGVDSQNFIQ